jgi:hypothetical protein
LAPSRDLYNINAERAEFDQYIFSELFPG